MAIVVGCLLIISILILLYDQLNDNRIQLSRLILQYTRESVECRTTQSIEHRGGQSIHYVHWSNGTWNRRQLCAVESSAVHHPRSLITIYTTAPPHPSMSTWTNVRVTPVDLDSEYRGTPLEGTQNTTGLPLALLWKHGGIYLESDVVVVRPLDQLVNSVSLEWDGVHFVSSTGLLAFEAGHPLVWTVMTGLAASEQLSTASTSVLTAALHRWCSNGQLSDVQGCCCDGVAVLPFNATHPHPSTTLNVSHDTWSSVLAVHLPAEKTKNFVGEAGDGSFIDGLYQENCPSTHREMMKAGYF